MIINNRWREQRQRNKTGRGTIRTTTITKWKKKNGNNFGFLFRNYFISNCSLLFTLCTFGARGNSSISELLTSLIDTKFGVCILSATMKFPLTPHGSTNALDAKSILSLCLLLWRNYAICVVNKFIQMRAFFPSNCFKKVFSFCNTEVHQPYRNKDPLLKINNPMLQWSWSVYV